MDDMDELLVSLSESSAGGEDARLKLYQAITDRSSSTDDTDSSSSKSRALENRRDVILPVVVKDCLQDSCVQLVALELLGHLCHMASTWEAPAFQPIQASLLWGAVAEVLDAEASTRMVRISALFAISNHTMEPRLVEPSIEQLAPGVARSMAHASTVVRQTSARAAHVLLGAAPGAMALCARCAVANSEEENTCWVRGLLRLCVDDAVLVREAALAAAERAVSLCNLRGSAGVAAWVLGEIRDGTLNQALRRVVLGRAESRSPPAPALPAAEGGRPAERSNEPRYAKQQLVKQAIRAWAVHLSLADLDSLLLRPAGGGKRLLDDGTDMFLWLSSKVDDHRDGVRMQAVEAWEMFAKGMVAQCGLDPVQTQARRVAHMLLTVLAKRITKDKSAAVRGATMSAVASLTASVPSALLKYFWESRTGNKKRQGLADVLQSVAKDDKSVKPRHYCARVLANLLPCFRLGPPDSHPALGEAHIDLAEAMPRLLFTLESLMEGKDTGCSSAPAAEDAASTVDAMAPPAPSSSRQSGGGSSAAAARLEVLSTDGLIANAWCGLAFWAMERAATAPATAAASPPAAATAAAAANQSNSDNRDEGSSGKGKGKGKARPGAGSGGGDSNSSSAAPQKRGEAGAAGAAADGGRPLLVLLRWLLGSAAATEPSNSGSASEAATSLKPAAGGAGSSAAEEFGPAPAATVPSSEKLVRWKASLLGVLIRGLTRRLALSRVGTAPGTCDDSRPGEDNLGGGCGAQEPPEQAWLDTPVDVSSLYYSASCDPECPECALTGDVIRGAVLREWGKTNEDNGGSGGKGGAAAGGEQGGGEKRRSKPPPPRFPLWLVLLEGVLRGNCCGCDKRGGGGDRRCPPVASFLAEALALAPSGSPARLLESLYEGTFFEAGGGGHGHGTSPAEPKERGMHGNGGTRGVLSKAERRQEERQCSALAVLGYAWRAEASRVLKGWKETRRSPRPDPSPSSGTTRTGLGGSVQGAGLLHDGNGNGSAAAGAPAQQEPSDELRQDTGSALLLLLRTASSLLSRPPPPRTPCSRSRGQETGVAAAEAQQACATNRSFEEGGGQDWSQDRRRLAAKMLGAESAGLWSDIFEARRSSRTHAAGFTRLVKHIAKACGSCALSAGEQHPGEKAAAGSGVPAESAESLTGGWALGGFSQTQTQPQKDKGAVAFASGGGKPAPAAAAAAAAATAEAARDTLAPPPPLLSLPVLAAAALALLRAAPKETKLRERAWKAGLATLAWTLTCSSSAAENVPPLAESVPPLPRSSAATAIAAEEGAGIAAEICGCLGAVRSTLETAAGTAVDSSGVCWSSGTAFPLDEASLSSVSRLLAAALGRSYPVSAADPPAAAAVAAAARGVSTGKVVGATPCAAEEARVARAAAAAAAAAVAAVPSVQSEIRSLVVCVLSAVRSFRPEVLEKSPGLLLALTPMLEAVLDLPPASSDGSTLQSSLLDAWNATFGNLSLKPPPPASPGSADGRTAWQKAFRPSLRGRLSELSRSQQKQVKVPSGITLPSLAGGGGTAPAPALAAVDGLNGSALGGKAGEGEASAQQPAAVDDLRGAAAGTGRGHAPPGFAGDGGVAGVLSGEGARRSFLRTAASSSCQCCSPPPSRAVATPKKRPASPTSRTDGAGSGGSAEKFVRVVGSGRGSTSRVPTRRAAVTTHTSLDGSQAMNPWEVGSQLPDTDPDSAPDAALEEALAIPPPTKNDLRPPSTPSSTSTASTKSPEGTGGSPGKRALEDAESETVDPNRTTTTPPCVAAAAAAARWYNAGMPSPSATASDRRVRPKPTADSGSGGGDDGDAVESLVVEGDACAGTAAATAAAAAAATKEAQEARTHATMLAISRAQVEQRRRQAETGCQEDGLEMSERTPTPSLRAPPSSTGQDAGGVDALLEDVRSLAQRVEAARSALSPQQLQEVGSLLQKIVHR